MKLLLSSILLVTLTVFVQSSFDNETNLRVLKSAKGSKGKKSKAVKSEKAAKGDKTKTTKVGVKPSKAPKGKGGKNGGGYYSNGSKGGGQEYHECYCETWTQDCNFDVKCSDVCDTVPSICFVVTYYSGGGGKGSKGGTLPYIEP